jgi:hypothetical protein
MIAARVVATAFLVWALLGPHDMATRIAWMRRGLVVLALQGLGPVSVAVLRGRSAGAPAGRIAGDAVTEAGFSIFVLGLLLPFGSVGWRVMLAVGVCLGVMKFWRDLRDVRRRSRTAHIGD